MSPPALNGMSVETAAKLACLFAGAIWGLFWIPLRWLGDEGIEGSWASVVFFLVPAMVLLPFQLLRREQLVAGGAGLQITAFLAAISLTLYALAVVYTEVMRAMLLFYLTPLWSTLAARVVLGQPITRQRFAAMAIALAGMLVIFGLGSAFPWPRNIGDWMGLVSGMLWAAAAVRLRLDTRNHPLEITSWYFGWCALISLAMALLLDTTGMPDRAQVASVLPWLVPMLLLLVVPGAYASMWGPKHLDPGLVGLLFMTEITVGTLTAALWAGEPFGLREALGVVLVSLAALAETPVFSWLFGAREPESA